MYVCMIFNSEVKESNRTPDVFQLSLIDWTFRDKK